jgi:hypothetical protein
MGRLIAYIIVTFIMALTCTFIFFIPVELSILIGLGTAIFFDSRREK